MIYCNRLDNGNVLIEQIDTVTGVVHNEWLLKGDGRETAASLMLYALMDEDEIMIFDDLIGEMFEAAIEGDEDIVMEEYDECCGYCCEYCGDLACDSEEDSVSDEESDPYAELAALLFDAIFRE